MGRRPYTTRVRPFQDSNITVKIRWYPARREDGTLPFPSRICSLDWHAFPYITEGVGEVYGASRNYNRAKPIPGPVRDHICGTRQEHGEGGLLADPRPPMIYLPSGLPVCCEPGRRESRVRVSAGPRSRYSDERVYRSRVSIATSARSTTTRSTPYRSRIRISTSTARSYTLRSDPIRSRVPVSVDPLSLTTRVDPYRSRVHVRVDPRSEWYESFLCTSLASSCAGAPASVPGHWCYYDGGRRGDEAIWGLDGWRMWRAEVGREYRVRVKVILGTPLAGTIRIWEGDECGALSLVEEFAYTDLDISYLFVATASRIWLEIDELLASDPLTIQIRVDE